MTQNKEVADDFANGIDGTRTANMFIEGRVIYSYGYHFPIALKLNGNIALFNLDGYSNTTSRHKSLVARALQRVGYRLEFIKTEKLKSVIDKKINNFNDIIIEEI